MLLYCKKCKRETWHYKGKCDHCKRIERKECFEWMKELSLSYKIDLLVNDKLLALKGE